MSTSANSVKPKRPAKGKTALFDVWFQKPNRMHTVRLPARILEWVYSRRFAFLQKDPRTMGYSEIRRH